MNTILIAIIVVVVLILLLIFAYNRIIALEQQAREAWANIDVALKNAIDLIKNLVNTVKAAYGAESKFYVNILDKYKGIASEYSKYISAIRGGNLGDAVNRATNIFNAIYPIVLELPKWPELPNPKFSEEFKKLHEDLKTAIERIMYARQFYNQAVREFNVTIKTIPFVFIASLMHKKELPYWQLEEQVRRSFEEELSTGKLTEDLTKEFKF